MTIMELKEMIKDLPDDMPVGSDGHFGELLECFEAGVISVYKNRSQEKQEIFSIKIEDAGEYPD